MTEDEIGAIIVDCAVGLHRNLGTGLFEHVYEVLLAYDLAARGLDAQRQVLLPLCYKGVRFDEGFRIDLVVEDKVVVEIKSVESLQRVHRKQVQTYLKLTGMKLGFVLNFGGEMMKDGIWRVVNGVLE